MHIVQKGKKENFINKLIKERKRHDTFTQYHYNMAYSKLQKLFVNFNNVQFLWYFR